MERYSDLDACPGKRILDGDELLSDLGEFVLKVLSAVLKLLSGSAEPGFRASFVTGISWIGSCILTLRRLSPVYPPSIGFTTSSVQIPEKSRSFRVTSTHS